MYYQRENPHGGFDPLSEGRDAAPLDFSASINPMGPPQAVREAAAQALNRMDRYPDPCCRALVRGIAAAEGMPEEQVLVGCGASELIWAWCDALRPATAAVPIPCFSEYGAALARCGGRLLPLPLSVERDFLPEDSFLERLEVLRPEAVFLCSPNNPTGRLLPPALGNRLLDWCRRRGARLLLDECFLPLSEGGEGFRDRLTAHPELFLLRAFTKSHGMAGLRLGYGLCADTGLLAAMAERTPPWTVSGPAQAAGLAALGETAYLTESRTYIRRERRCLAGELASLGLRVIPSEANFLLFQGPPSLGNDLKRRGILLRDCGDFPGLAPGWYRAAVRTRDENRALIAALRQLREEGVGLRLDPTEANRQPP